MIITANEFSRDNKVTLCVSGEQDSVIALNEKATISAIFSNPMAANLSALNGQVKQMEVAKTLEAVYPYIG